MSNNWGSQESDWQLKKLQQDCLRTSDRILGVCFDSLQREVKQVHQEYEKRFGPQSAQFTEYITMLMQKMQASGLTTLTCMEWLSQASSGYLPQASAPADFDTQSQTLKHIPEEYRQGFLHEIPPSETPGFQSSYPNDDEFGSSEVDALNAYQNAQQHSQPIIAAQPLAQPSAQPIAQQLSAQTAAQNSMQSGAQPVADNHSVWGAAPESNELPFNPWGEPQETPPMPATRPALNSLMPTTWENGVQVSPAFKIAPPAPTVSAGESAASQSISQNNQLAKVDSVDGFDPGTTLQFQRSPLTDQGLHTSWGQDSSGGWSSNQAPTNPVALPQPTIAPPPAPAPATPTPATPTPATPTAHSLAEAAYTQAQSPHPDQFSNQTGEARSAAPPQYGWGQPQPHEGPSVEPQFRVSNSSTSEWAKQQQISQQFQIPPSAPFGGPDLPPQPQISQNWTPQSSLPSAPAWGQLNGQNVPPQTNTHSQGNAQMQQQFNEQIERRENQQEQDYEYNPATAWD
ncbi:MAG: hypothetical protein K2Y32_18900 [Candidatus Obscuribacterales bacterium]|nr:hypothetical protein [Candidatus Obscuribacterales bacterium]